MQSLILVNKNDLRELLKEMIPITNATDPIDDQKDYFSLDEGLSYINERGLTISKSTLYKKTADREIPFQRWGGKKIVFLRDELDQWISKQLSGKEDKVSEITKSVADSARRKEGR